MGIKREYAKRELQEEKYQAYGSKLKKKNKILLFYIVLFTKL